MASQNQAWSLYRGEDGSIVLTGEDTTNPTGWALAFTVSLYPGQSPVTFSSTSLTIGGPNSAGKYTITMPLTRAQTAALTSSDYHCDFWRTDSGSNIRLAGGRLELLTPVRLSS